MEREIFTGLGKSNPDKCLPESAEWKRMLRLESNEGRRKCTGSKLWNSRLH